jgi:hypothetical protein
MSRVRLCPLCEADVTDSWQGYDPDVGVMSSSWYCDACDLIIEDDDDGEVDHDEG